jgi:DNA-binding MarR family transcriptional regulator
VAFALTWLLREIPLRATAGAPDRSDALTGASGDDPLHEIERALSDLARRDNRWDLYQRLATRAGVDLSPPQLWMLARLGECTPISRTELLRRLPVDARPGAATLEELHALGMVAGDEAPPLTLTDTGRAAHDCLVRARSDGLREYLGGWEPDEHPEIARMVERLTHDLVSAIPSPPAPVG